MSTAERSPASSSRSAELSESTLGLSHLPLLLARDPLLLRIHKAWAWVVIVGNGLAGAWALAAHHWPKLRSRALWWFVLLAELAIFVQVGLGVGLIAGLKLRAPGMHVFYGFVAAITVAIIYSYRSQLKRQKYLLYGLGGLFLMGLALRALVLAHPGTS